ncbi:hypothetical protein EKN38_25195 [Enterobacter sp. WCHEn045836]|uniref:hypothetical protein n=1 Tax=Enterobacter sp. WCHEn045836 TaxID=2497434 RepID=UPI000F81F174|nr:hypothetical protein [Enterobacter sp. WCHEn045836]RTP93724.1 hypothetical protein EKN38_25195 [Enterobacter sp. WCHEn045836]
MLRIVELPQAYQEGDYPVRSDVVALVKANNHEELNKVVVSCNTKGEPVIFFEDAEWNIRHYFQQNSIHKHTFSFSEFNHSPQLTIELKMVVYGWLFHKSSFRSTPAKPSTLIERFSKLKLVYRYLKAKRMSSITDILNNSTEWLKFESFLSEKNYSQRTLHNIFNSVNHVLALQGWLKIKNGSKKFNPVSRGNKISDLTSQQTLAIPERLADEIFGTAIEMVEEAYPYRREIAKTEQALQDNYLEGKALLESKIESGAITWLTDNTGSIKDTHRFAQEILKLSPESHKTIVKRYLHDFSLRYLSKHKPFNTYYNLLITACYICCGAFSGMRDSELSELTSDSYFTDEFDGRVFHILQSWTFKMGQKKTTWVTAPVSGKAIQLVSVLTESWRNEYNLCSGNPTQVIWLSRIRRSRPPAFSNWHNRLRNFCKQFNIKVTESDYQECMDSNPNSFRKIQKTIKQGELWPLSPHQFRRSLAFYTIRHRLGTTVALKQQYKHLYLQMTEWYTEGGTVARLKNLAVDNQLQELLDNTKLEETTNKIFSFVHSEGTLSGSHGKAIVAMRSDIPHIYSSWDIIYQAVKSGLLTLHGTLHSYCKNGYNCDMDGVINPAFCVNCSDGGSIIDEENAKWWKQKHYTLTEYLSSALSVSPSVYSHCITQIRAAESVMKDFGMTFSIYKHPVEIVEL